MKAFTKVVRLGRGPDGDVFSKIEWDGKRLSITGVEGPTKSGNARGSCGQIIMHFKEYDARGYQTVADITPAPSWTVDLIRRFFDAWDRWHLNDMRSGCEHQRAEGWGDEELEVVTYRLTAEALHDQSRVKAEAMERLKATGKAELSEQQQALLALPWETHEAPDADGPGSGMYQVAKRETKRANWVRPDEHPRGVLTKACPVCGYKYGTAWLTEDVPANVLAFLGGLPDADKTPAWV